MPVTRHPATFRTLSAAELTTWRGTATATASDAMDRSQAMSGAIKPIKAGLSLCGQARTIQAMVGDNSALHLAVSLARPGEVLAIDAGGHEDTAVWVDILTTAAIGRGIAGIVLDGATRDVARIRDLGFPVFCRAVVPRGPHKGFGGVIDGPVAVGGVPVNPGDLVLGDDDGVTVVPLARLAAVRAALDAIVEKERQLLAGVAAGRSTAQLLGIAQATDVVQRA
jgi:regulator of RNase E activity RraA